jgi:hypothetical protein
VHAGAEMRTGPREEEEEEEPKHKNKHLGNNVSSVVADSPNSPIQLTLQNRYLP